MKDYEYYSDEMKRDVNQVILGQEAHEDNLLLGRILTWIPRKIFSLIKKIIHNRKL